jgi:hypothetical protein
VFKVSRIGKRPAKILDRFVATGEDFFERLVEAPRKSFGNRRRLRAVP